MNAPKERTFSMTKAKHTPCQKYLIHIGDQIKAWLYTAAGITLVICTLCIIPPLAKNSSHIMGWLWFAVGDCVALFLMLCAALFPSSNLFKSLFEDYSPECPLDGGFDAK